MDGNAPRRGGSTVRTLAIAVGVVVLVAWTGSVPAGEDTVRRPSEGFVDTAFSLFIVMMALCAVFVAVALTWFRRYDPTAPARTRRGPLRSIVSLILSIALLALFV